MNKDELLIDLNYVLSQWSSGLGLFDAIPGDKVNTIIENATHAAFGQMTEFLLDIPTDS